MDQFLACLWKQNLCYWRNPQYSAVRFFYTVIISLMLGTICWRFGSKRDNQQDIFNAMGSMYVAVLFIGVTNGGVVQPVVSVERFVSYRERAAGMYSALPFALAQVAIEFPYVLGQAIIYSTVFYAMASFEWAFLKFTWFLDIAANEADGESDSSSIDGFINDQNVGFEESEEYLHRGGS